jgi:hypothetical protein
MDRAMATVDLKTDLVGAKRWERPL